ncbi:MAG: YeeE/YedE family protein [Polyangiaceae bacterium]
MSSFEFPFFAPLLGGVFIGAAASYLLLSQGRIAGISGILGGLVSPKVADKSWRVAFLLGLFVAGTLASIALPGSTGRPTGPLPLLVVAGLLVGFGARLGGGCTSGHGVCGVSRLSSRSLVATAVFIATGALTVFLVRHVFGGTFS